jgi:hypothetical protein
VLLPSEWAEEVVLFLSKTGHSRKQDWAILAFFGPLFKQAGFFSAPFSLFSFFRLGSFCEIWKVAFSKLIFNASRAF